MLGRIGWSMQLGRTGRYEWPEHSYHRHTERRAFNLHRQAIRSVGSMLSRVSSLLTQLKHQDDSSSESGEGRENSQVGETATGGSREQRERKMKMVEQIL
jgi:hypothetical protein